jgi:hypothetical protein
MEWSEYICLEAGPRESFPCPTETSVAPTWRTADRRQRRCQLQLTGDMNSPVLRSVRRTSMHGLPQRSSFISGVELNQVTPIGRPRDRPLRQEDRGTAPSSLGQAGPRPVLGTRDQPRPKGVALNVATEAKEMGITRHWKGLVAPLIDVTGAGGLSPSVPSLAVSRGQPRHERRQFAVDSGPQHQVEVVWHETVRQTPHRHALLRLAKYPEESAVVLGSIKKLQSPDSPIQDVEDDTGRSGPRSVWHDRVAIKILANNRPGIE